MNNKNSSAHLQMTKMMTQADSRPKWIPSKTTRSLVVADGKKTVKCKVVVK